MVIKDADRVSGGKLTADICIIGAGPAGITLARKLSDESFDIIVADSGNTRHNPRAQELNAMDAVSNFTYRNGKSNRIRQVGGSANLWAGRVVPYDFNPEFDQEWGSLPCKLKPYYDEAFRHFNIDPDIQALHNRNESELYAYWAERTERFNRVNRMGTKSRTLIYTNLTFFGKICFESDSIKCMTFINGQNQQVRIYAAAFIFAMGAIENTRMLLVVCREMKEQTDSGFQNVGRYVMDHPRISHGMVESPSDNTELSWYRMKASPLGTVKAGIRNNAVNTRVYCNLFAQQGKITRKLLNLPIAGFQRSAKRLFMKENGLLRTLAGACVSLPFIHSDRVIGKRFVRYVNSQKSETYRVMTYCEQLPRKQNRIEPDIRTDRNGVPLPRLVNNIHPDELEEVRVFYHRLSQIFGNMGCIFRYDETRINNPNNYTDSSHILGGTRYSADRSKSVLNEDLSVHGIRNLYITGSSAFPTSGVENPTHLIVVLSLYLADILKKA